jgi:hypothetical protein
VLGDASVKEHDFKQSGEKTSAGKLKDACLMCGKQENSHRAAVLETEVHIFFQGRLWRFKNWQEAREKGFYLA